MSHGDDRAPGPPSPERALDLEPDLPPPPSEKAPLPPPAPAPGDERTPPADHFNVVELPFTFLRILRDPAGGLARVHIRGQGAFLTGLIFGIVAVLVMAWFQVAGHPAHVVVKGLLGGLAFLATATLISLVLRATAGAVRDVDWHDDLFLVGGALSFSLAGFLIGGLLGATPALRVFAHAGSIAGFALFTFSLHGGLVSVGRVETSRAIWITAAVLGVGTLISSALGFLPVLS
jgi:hypothetical protein